MVREAALSMRALPDSDYARLWGPLWTHSAFGFESMNGHLTSMLHSTYRVADQLLFSIDVHNTLSILCEKLERVESEQTLSFLAASLGSSRRKNMILLLPDIHMVGAAHSENIVQHKREAIKAATGADIEEALVFHRLYCRGMFHSVHHSREGGKRDSSVCCFSYHRKECYGTLFLSLLATTHSLL